MGSKISGCVTDFFTYETTKSVVVKSWSVGIINRIVQLLIIIYFVCYVFIYEKAYQVTDTGIESSVMTKVKGFGLHNNRVMDQADYVLPSQGASVFCIMTQLIITENQFQGKCPETVSLFFCNDEKDCEEHMGESYLGNGFITGKCLLPSIDQNGTSSVINGTQYSSDINGTQSSSDINGTQSSSDINGTQSSSDKNGTQSSSRINGTQSPSGKNGTQSSSKKRILDTKTLSLRPGRCEVRGWCPAENERIKGEPMLDVENFTIFIKNSVRFPLFNVTRGNFPPTLTSSQIKRCKYHPVTNPLCPIFLVKDILKYINKDLASLADKGGEIGINIEWKCNLDLDIEKCLPRYAFTQLDLPFRRNRVSKGYNFRFAKYYKTENGTEFRTLHKAFALRFDIMVTGNAGKFSTIPTLINIVAAFTSIGLGTVLCDIILLNFLKGADQYKAKKFEEVSGVQIETQLDATLSRSPGSELSIKQGMKSSYDSGAGSLSAEQAI